MRDLDEDTITQAVLARHTAATNPRLREVMTSLVQHLHAFARDIELTEDEYQALHAAAVRFRPVSGPAVLPRLLRSHLRR